MAPGLSEVVRVFGRLGTTAFGGPAAHVAFMRDEVVHRRRWLSDADFLDLVAAVNLIPGPNSTELALHLGFRRAGWPGFLGAGLAFVLPAFALVLGLAMLYVRYGTRPEVSWLLYGLHPVVVAVVADAAVQLGRSTLRRPRSVAAALLAGTLALAGAHELLLLALCALAFVAPTLRGAARTGVAVLGAIASATTPLAAAAAAGPPVTLARLWWFFLEVGSVLFGSGYVLVAFLRADLVERWAWLSDRQLLDAVAVGQVTPGPLFTTATFVGYVLAGFPGAVVSTVAIFLPAFGLVAATHHLVRRLRASRTWSAALDGLCAASLGLMAAVAIELARQSVVDGPTLAVGAGAWLVLLVWRPSALWLLLAGALVGALAGR